LIIASRLKPGNGNIRVVVHTVNLCSASPFLVRRTKQTQFVYRMWYTILVRKKPEPRQSEEVQSETPENQGKRVPAIFYRTEAGGEPVRDWLKGLSAEDRKRIG
jgi:hypothetical protein